MLIPIPTMKAEDTMTQPVTTMEDEEGNPITIGYPDSETPTDDTPVAEPVVETPPVTDTQSVETPPEPIDESQYLIKLDKRSLAQEVARLAKEDPEAANTLFSLAGRKTAERYQARLEELDIQAREARRELRAKEIEKMPDEEIEHRFATDPNFAREYAEIIHRDPNAAVQEIEMRRMGRMLNDTIYGAVDYGLPEEKAEEINKALLAGVFDKDSSGRPLSINESMLHIQQVILREINSSKTTTNGSTSKVEPPAPSKPSALSGAGPDTSTTGITKAKVGASSVDEYTRALEHGGKLPSSEEIDRITAKYLEE